MRGMSKSFGRLTSIVLALILVLNPITASAATTITPGSSPIIDPADLDAHYVVGEDSYPGRSITLGGGGIYFVTQDPQYDPMALPTPPTTIDISYKGTQTADILYAPNGDYDAHLATITAADNTIFFDDGTYQVAQNNMPYILDAPGLTVVGSQAYGSGTTTLQRNDNMNGYRFQQVGVSLHGLNFDAQDQNVNSGAAGWRYFIFASGGDFLMKDCVLENIGDSPSDTKYAINFSADPPSTPSSLGQSMEYYLDGVTVKNSNNMWSVMIVNGSYGVNVHINDLTVTNTKARDSVIALDGSNDESDPSYLAFKHDNTQVYLYGDIRATGNGLDSKAKLVTGTLDYTKIGAAADTPYAHYTTLPTVALYEDFDSAFPASGALYDTSDGTWVLEYSNFAAQLDNLCDILAILPSAPATQYIKLLVPQGTSIDAIDFTNLPVDLYQFHIFATAYDQASGVSVIDPYTTNSSLSANDLVPVSANATFASPSASGSTPTLNFMDFTARGGGTGQVPGFALPLCGFYSTGSTSSGGGTITVYENTGGSSGGTPAFGSNTQTIEEGSTPQASPDDLLTIPDESVPTGFNPNTGL